LADIDSYISILGLIYTAFHNNVPNDEMAA
jgi:hypothetical protein